MKLTIAEQLLAAFFILTPLFLMIFWKDGIKHFKKATVKHKKPN